MKQLIIDEEFENLLPQLSSEEYSQLEESIKKDGVLSPIIVWNSIIVDGHNRYKICRDNGIEDFQTREVTFNDREEVIEWMLRHQLGRRNLSDFERIRIALRYEEVIAKKARERQLSTLKNSSFSSNEPNDGKDFHTCDEVGKIAGASGATVKRAKTIITEGTPEQMARAIKGGKEADGRSNSISAIEKEIRATKTPKETDETTKICRECHRELPIEEFYMHKSGHRRNLCKRCFNSVSHAKDLSGKSIKSVDIGISEDELRDMLYNDERDVNYTIEDLIEEVVLNGENGVSSVQSSLEIHRDLLEDVDNIKQVNAAIDSIMQKLDQLKVR